MPRRCRSKSRPPADPVVRRSGSKRRRPAKLSTPEISVSDCGDETQSVAEINIAAIQLKDGLYESGLQKEGVEKEPGVQLKAVDGWYDCRNELVYKEKQVVDLHTKLAAVKASQFVVAITTHNIPSNMRRKEPVGVQWTSGSDEESWYFFPGSGTIIECEDLGDHTFATTILTHASLFQRGNRITPEQVEVDVYLPDGKLYEGEVIACDFHYNIAAIQIHSDFPLETATLRSVDDVFSIDPAQQLVSKNTEFQLRPHSSLFKVHPETKLTYLWRSFTHPDDLQVASGCFCSQNYFSGLDCNELYCMKDIISNKKLIDNGGPVINCNGEVIGIMSPFLPSNIVSRWWTYFKIHGKYRRPWLGMKVANLHEACLKFLKDFIAKFTNISTGVVVLQVAEGSPAFCSGIRPKDVIVGCDGRPVQSKLELFEKVWDKVGEQVEFCVLRVSSGSRLKLHFVVAETTPDQFYKWKLPRWETTGSFVIGHARCLLPDGEVSIS